ATVPDLAADDSTNPEDATANPYGERRTCRSDEAAFFLRASIDDASLIGCNALGDVSGEKSFDAIAKGGSLSYDDNNGNDDGALNIKGVFGYMIPGRDAKQLNPNGWVRSETAYAIYLDADGALIEDTSNVGVLELGVRAQMAFTHSDLPFLGLDVTIYALTDFDLDAEAYGARVSITPENAAWNLNGYTLQGKGNYWRIVFEPTLDFLSVEDAGETDLDSNEGYLWAGSKLGLEAFSTQIGASGASFETGLNAYDDLQSDSDAVDFYARAELYLNEKRTISIRIKYEDGTPRNTLEERETFSIAFGLAF
ncbi:MAG: hypothetical protein AAGA63_08925, partial [Pseudomonadota bacterium]